MGSKTQVHERKMAILTIGHSDHSLDFFLSLLAGAGVTAIADVRSSPFSRWAPQFNKDALQEELRRQGIAYAFLGNELGGRPKEKTLFADGVANYEAMARTQQFCEGIYRIIKGSQKHQIALMCSEHEPLDCHRCLLVGRQLAMRGHPVKHILANGKLEAHDRTELRLLDLEGRALDDLFLPYEERIAAAYRERARRIAFGSKVPHQSYPAPRLALK
jgi:uncharacterized protein (DUF488 family)